MNKFLIILLSLGLFLSSNFASAIETDDCEVYCADVENNTTAEGTICYCNPLGDKIGLEAITGPIIDFIFKISIVVVPVLVVYGAFMIITAAGDADKIKQARAIIFWTLIGFVIVLLSRGVSDLIEVIIGI